MNGVGNDFVLINNIVEKIPQDKFSTLAEKLCNRRTGIGADGIIFMEDSQDNSDIKMNFYNSDGSRGEMCGNGARCLARFAYVNLGLTDLDIRTDSGIVKTNRIDETVYKTQLNNPSIEKYDYPVDYEGKIYKGSYIELGDPGLPHFCLEFDFEAISTESLRKFATFLRYYEGFPKGANINFFKILDENHIKELTYERGVEDFTLACGTGTGSVATALVKNKKIVGNIVHVSVPGGELEAEIVLDDDVVKEVYLIGETDIVFDGILEGGL